MSRSGYSDDCDGWALIRWRGAVNSAIRGARGQKLLRDTLAALDAMPIKELASESLVTATGQYCTLGALGAARGIDMRGIDPENAKQVGATFDAAQALIREIVFENDERAHWNETPAGRWVRMRAWVASQIKEDMSV